MRKDRGNLDSLNQYLEEEAAYLEQHTKQHEPDLPKFDVETDYARLMEAVAQKERQGAQAELWEGPPKRRSLGKGHHKIPWKIGGTIAAILVLAIALDTGTIGQKVYKPESVVEHRDGEVVIKVDNEEWIEREIDEETVYQEIEERLGIRALRLGYKPKGMELYKVEILEEFGEAKIQYMLQGQVLTVYMCRDFSKNEISIKMDKNGKAVGTADIFYLDMTVDVLEMVNENKENTYFAEIGFFDTYFFMEGMIEKDIFFEIVENLYDKNA